MHSEHEQARAGHSESEDLPLTELKCRDTVEGDTDMEATEAVIGPDRYRETEGQALGLQVAQGAEITEGRSKTTTRIDLALNPHRSACVRVWRGPRVQEEQQRV